MDPEELKKLSAEPEEASPSDVVDKFLEKNLPGKSIKTKKKIVIKPKHKKDQEISSTDFAKKA